MRGEVWTRGEEQIMCGEERGGTEEERGEEGRSRKVRGMRGEERRVPVRAPPLRSVHRLLLLPSGSCSREPCRHLRMAGGGRSGEDRLPGLLEQRGVSLGLETEDARRRMGMEGQRGTREGQGGWQVCMG